jgi:hypothetical protein
MRTEHDSLYFGGRWLPASTDEQSTVVSPYGPVGLGAYLGHKSIDGAP